jgi:predicted transcriptional regulator
VRPVSIKLTEHLDRQLTALARRRRSNRSAILREALEAFAQQSAQPSVTAAAADLVGALRGPKDLSVASKRMAGYGQ